MTTTARLERRDQAYEQPRPAARLDGDLAGNLPELAEVCQAWGTALAALHTARTPASGRPLAPRPWLLRPEHRAPSQRQVPRGSAYASVLRTLRCDPLLCGVAAEVADRWAEQCWIHGNLTPGNVVVSRAPELQVRFVDFENAGVGDPSWDLAGALETIELLAAGWGVAAEMLAEYFLQGYRRGSGPGRVDPGMRALHAASIAWRLAGAEPVAADPVAVRASVEAWLGRARTLARRAGRSFAIAA